MMKIGIVTDTNLTLVVALTLLTSSFVFAEDVNQLPDPDGKPADMSKPVQVYILLGQSNMLGFGKISQRKAEGSLDTRGEGEEVVPLPRR